MKKLLTVILGAFLLFTLSGCEDDVYIEPDVIAVQFENVRYEGALIIVDVWVTNGTDTDYYLGDVDFWFELPESMTGDIDPLDWDVAGANFTINENVPAGDYRDYEIEFTFEYIFYTEAQLTELDVTLDDLDFYYQFEE